MAQYTVNHACDVPAEPTAIRHIWKITGTGRYTFSDETENFAGVEYDTIEEAVAGMKLYCEHML